MCNAFLWKGATGSTRGAKISWDSCCTSKASGGLGLKRLADWNRVLGLKLIWLLFSSAGSLWVSWVKVNLLRGRSFWTLDSRRSGSWIWKQICKLRPIARPFIFCELGSGTTASFWEDDWTGLGPLLELTGQVGPRISGLPLNAVVSDAIRGDSWWLRSSRTRHPTLSLLRQCLPPVEPILSSECDDCYRWKIGDNKPSSSFSTSQTWEKLHPSSPTVPWHKSVWFSHMIPKHAFGCWVVARDRMHTRDRLRSWGLQVPSLCLLCNRVDESRQHLFFDCAVSKEIWSSFTVAANLTCPTQFEQALIWINHSTPNKNIKVILKLIFQAVIYTIWKERNARLHSDAIRTPGSLIKEIKTIMRSKLDPMSRAQRNTPSTVSFLTTWFSYFQG